MARILLVDDDRDIRELGCALLTNAGHEAFPASSVVQAIEFLDQRPVDVVITDANMPRHSGFDLIRTLRRNKRCEDLSIVMLTGRRERKDIERAVELGVHDYIVKPIDPALFLQKVNDLLERRPPQERPEAEFASLKLNAPAKASVGVEIASISEIGLLLRSTQRFNDGARIELDSEIFGKIGIVAPLLRVASSVEAGSQWETRVTFVGADERTLSKIRAWVFANTARGRAA